MKLIWIFAVLLSIFLVPPFGRGAGVSPGGVTYIYTPGEVLKGDFSIINQEDAAQLLDIERVGPFADYIQIDIPGQILLGPKSSQLVHFTFTMPPEDKIERPGSYPSGVKVYKQPEGSGLIKVRTAVVFGILVKVPFPGKYAEVTLVPPSFVPKEGPSEFVLDVLNLGGEDLQVSGEVKILNSEGKIMDFFKTGSGFLKIRESTKLYAIWNPREDLEPGTYQALAEIDYGGEEKAVHQKTISVGDIYVDILSTEYGDLKAGEISKFTVHVKSYWNKEIENVYAEVRLYDQWNEVGFGKGESKNIPPKATDQLNVFVETSDNLQPGDHHARITAYFAGKKNVKDFDIIVESSSNLIYTVTLIVIVIIIVLGIVGFIKYR